jgi:hypothetical protein
MAWTTVNVATDTNLFNATSMSASSKITLTSAVVARSDNADYGASGTMVAGPWEFASGVYNTVFGVQYELVGNKITAKSGGGGGPVRPTTGILYPITS